jgi:hypothetical protein
MFDGERAARIDYFRALGFFSSEDDKMKMVLF